MTTTYYASLNVPSSFLDVDHSGTSSTSTDVIELRMGNGTYAPNRKDIILALDRIRRWVVQGGLDSLGSNVPPPV